MADAVVEDRQELAALRASVRAFAEREVMPGAAARDRSGEYPAALVRRLGELDLMGVSVPGADGGLGMSTRAQLVAIEELARADAALASIHTAHYLGLEPLLLTGTPAQRDRWLRPLAQGRALAGFALTEPGAGSDIGSMRTTARPDGGGWRINGGKTYISNAAEADVLVVFASVDTSAGIRGVTAFVVPRSTPGVSFSARQEKLGITSAPTYSVYLDDVVVPHDHLLGEPGRGGKLALQALNRARIDVAAMANGIALRAWELARSHARSRVQFGQPIGDFQAVQLLLGQMDASLTSARLVADWAAGLKDEGADLRRAASMAKYVATEACSAVVDSALQVHGGAGFMRESEIERLYRDCRVLRIFEGTSQIQLLGIAASAPTSSLDVLGGVA